MSPSSCRKSSRGLVMPVTGGSPPVAWTGEGGLPASPRGKLRTVDPDVRIERDGDGRHLAAWLELHNRLSPLYAMTPEESRHFSSLNPALVDLVAIRDGAVVGIACTWPDREAPPGGSANAIVMVEPAERGRGVGGRLYAAVSDVAREGGATALDVSVYDRDADGLAIARHRGFAHVVSRDVHVG